MREEEEVQVCNRGARLWYRYGFAELKWSVRNIVYICSFINLANLARPVALPLSVHKTLLQLAAGFCVLTVALYRLKGMQSIKRSSPQH